MHKNIVNERREENQRSVVFFIVETKHLPVYYHKKCFPHFDYISNLVQKCIHQIEKIDKNIASRIALHSGTMIKITYIGEITKDNLKTITKRKGKLITY